MMSGYFWVVLGGLVIFSTKYLTSLRLRGLADRMQREQTDTLELRHTLVEAEEKEGQLKTETDRLQAKVSGLRNVVANLERSLQRLRDP
jgi:peptidoglycan hydrolase CwlO-like protein